IAVTLATMLAAGSLGSTIALARDKTFQALAMTALVLVIWIGAWEAVYAVAGDAVLGGLSVKSIAAAASPIRAILVAAQPDRDVIPALEAADTWFLIVAFGIAAFLNGVAILRLRVWNPGREVMQR